MATLRERIFGPRKPKEPEVKQEVLVAKPQGESPAVETIAVSDKTILEGIDVDTAEEGKLIELYRKMDNDSIISAALDLYADNATQVDERTGHVISVVCAESSHEEEFNDFLHNIVNVDTEAWDWVRMIARDGKLFLDTKTDSNDWSFIPVQDPSKVNALTKGTNRVEYFVVAPEEKKEAWEGRYFSPTYAKSGHELKEFTIEEKDRFISAFNKKELIGKMTVATETKLRKDPIEQELLIQTGRSALASVVTTYQTLSALEDAIFINRLTKSTEFKVVQVDVSESNNKQAKQIVDGVKNAFKSSEMIDQATNRYQNRQSPIPINDFIYVPVKGTKGSITIETVGGEVTEQKLADIEYYRNKEFAGLGVLKAYLGFEETTPGGLGDATITMLDERLGRKIKRLQEILKDVIRQIISYYWRYSSVDRSSADLPHFEVLVGKVSTKEDEAKRERLDRALDIATKILSVVTDERFIDKVDDDKLFQYIFRDIVGIDPKEFNNQPNEETVNLRVKEIEEGIKRITERNKKKKNEEKSAHKKYLSKLEKKSIQEVKALLDEYDIFLEDFDGSLVPLSEAIVSSRYKKGILSEKTFNQLKADSKTKDPARLKKSKKIVVKFEGLTDENLIKFIVTAEDPAKNSKEGKPTSYETKISLKDLAYLVKATIEDGEKMTEADLVNLAIQGDVSLGCTCPAAKYWGQNYLGTRDGYSIDKETRPPKRNIPTQPVCKHTLATLTALPFWWNTIVRELRSAGILPSVMSDEEKAIVLDSNVEGE